MVHHSCGVANSKCRLLVCLLVGVMVTLTLRELYRRVRTAIRYQIAKRYGRWTLARDRRGG